MKFTNPTCFILLMVVGCGSGDLSQPELERKARDLVAARLERFRSDLEALRQQGLAADEPISVAFSFHAQNRQRAESFQAVLEQSTSYESTVQWIKEPETGWFVMGELPAFVSTPVGDRELLEKMVNLGLRHGCEIYWWQPVFAKRHGLSNNRLKLPARGRPVAN
jgi:hypothetical protein